MTNAAFFVAEILSVPRERWEDYDAVLGLVKCLTDLDAENTAMRNFMGEFAATKFGRLSAEALPFTIDGWQEDCMYILKGLPTTAGQ